MTQVANKFEQGMRKCLEILPGWVWHWVNSVTSLPVNMKRNSTLLILIIKHKLSTSNIP